MKKILIVDDSKSQQLLASALLKNMEDVEVAIANNGTDALGWLTTNGEPDLILLDIVMPDISGFDLCRQIRTELELKTVPIVFCSEKNQEFDRFWALRQGGNAYIAKPYNPTDLLKTIQDYLE
jgi:twitching motility two-component system response regulator PilH